MSAPPTCCSSANLPTPEDLKGFCQLLSFYRTLPTSFVRDIIMKAPSSDMMNTLARSVLTLYSYDEDAEDISIPNVLRQCIQLIALFPLLSVYGYQAYRHYHDGQSLFIHQPDPKLSTSENILRILRPDCSYTELEAKVLDIALILHADHGGGNNSTFTTHVVTSSGTDTYSAIAAALGVFEGPQARRRQHQGGEDVRGHQRARKGLGRRRGALRLPAPAAAQGGLRPLRPDLRHGPRGVLPLRPQSQDHVPVR